MQFKQYIRIGVIHRETQNNTGEQRNPTLKRQRVKSTGLYLNIDENVFGVIGLTTYRQNVVGSIGIGTGGLAPHFFFFFLQS